MEVGRRENGWFDSYRPIISYLRARINFVSAVIK